LIQRLWRAGHLFQMPDHPGYGEFPKHGVTVEADALTEWNAVEDRYKRIRGLIDGRRLGCQAR
jgi:hypothetical protein